MHRPDFMLCLMAGSRKAPRISGADVVLRRKPLPHLERSNYILDQRCPSCSASLPPPSTSPSPPSKLSRAGIRDNFIMSSSHGETNLTKKPGATKAPKRTLFPRKSTPPDPSNVEDSEKDDVGKAIDVADGSIPEKSVPSVGMSELFRLSFISFRQSLQAADPCLVSPQDLRSAWISWVFSVRFAQASPRYVFDAHPLMSRLNGSASHR